MLDVTRGAIRFARLHHELVCALVKKTVVADTASLARRVAIYRVKTLMTALTRHTAIFDSANAASGFHSIKVDRMKLNPPPHLLVVVARPNSLDFGLEPQGCFTQSRPNPITIARGIPKLSTVRLMNTPSVVSLFVLVVVATYAGLIRLCPRRKFFTLVLSVTTNAS